MQRQVTLNIGDWADDGHGKYKTVRALIDGSDVSNEALKNNLNKFEKETGVRLKDLLENYQETQIEIDTFLKIIKSGVRLDIDEGPLTFNVDFEYFNLQNFCEDPENKNLDKETLEYLKDLEKEIESAKPYKGLAFNSAQLLLEIFGFEDNTFEYEIIQPKDDVIVGGYKAVINSFGYGLFS